MQSIFAVPLEANFAKVLVTHLQNAPVKAVWPKEIVQQGKLLGNELRIQQILGIEFLKIEIQKHFEVMFPISHFRFGVCCEFIADECGDEMNVNNTYIKNPEEFTKGSSCTYMIKPESMSKIGRIRVIKQVHKIIHVFISDICFIRLDFEAFVLKGPEPATSEKLEGVCTESLQVGTLSPLCGTNNGEHCKYIL